MPNRYEAQGRTEATRWVDELAEDFVKDDQVSHVVAREKAARGFLKNVTSLMDAAEEWGVPRPISAYLRGWTEELRRIAGGE